MLRGKCLSRCTVRSVARALSSTPANAELHDGRNDISAASCRASECVPRVANLSGTRGVIRLAGADVLTFLQVRHFDNLTSFA